MTPFRKLTSAETAALEALGNSAEDWSKVLVSEDFKPFQLLQSHLEGDVEIAAEARIVRSRVANYRIGTGSLVEGVTALECRRRSAFGNGVGVATMNECGGRTVKIFDRLSAQVAYVMAVYRHRPQTIAALEKMVDAYAEERSSEIVAFSRIEAPSISTPLPMRTSRMKRAPTMRQSLPTSPISDERSSA